MLFTLRCMALLAPLLAIGQASAADYQVTTQPGLVYAEHDGTKLVGDLYLPKGRPKAPILVAVHGGGWQVGSPAARPLANTAGTKAPLTETRGIVSGQIVSLRAALFKSENQLSSELLEELHEPRNCVRELIGVLSIGSRLGFVPHIVPRGQSILRERWSERQDLNLRRPRPERGMMVERA